MAIRGQHLELHHGIIIQHKTQKQSKSTQLNRRYRKQASEQSSDLYDLSSPDNGIGLGNLLSAESLVIEGAVVGVGVPVPAAEKVTAPAPEAGEAHLFPAAGASVSQSRRRPQLLPFFLRSPPLLGLFGREFLERIHEQRRS